MTQPAPTVSGFTPTDPTPTGNVGGAGSSGGGPTGSVDDLFHNLKEFQWKGVPVPVEETELELRHDLVVHKFVDRNGAYVESVGRHPLQITARIPFLNHIYNRSQQESWPEGALYPYQWQKFINFSLETTSGTLIHPELGPLNCKLEVAKTKWKGNVRGGVWLEATWIESDDTQASQTGQDLSSTEPSALLVSSANSLDANIATLDAAVAAQQNPLPPLEFSFDELANALVGVIDTTTILQKEFQGRAENVLYQADRVKSSIQASPILGPLAWPFFQDCERQKDTAYNIAQQAAIASGRPVLTKVLGKPMTLSQAALFTGSEITDFILLNYALVGLSVLPVGTTVSYYATTS
jgi:hypothetical protein